MLELVTFVKESLTLGHSREEIREVLTGAGWPDDEISNAFSQFADVAFPIPVPKRRQYTFARDAFLYLVTFAALYTTAIALGTLLFGVIDRLLPDVLSQRYEWTYDLDDIRWSIASIVVAFPIYFFLTRKHFIDYEKDPERRSSLARKWLTYMTLAALVGVLIVTMITLIGNVLAGEIAIRYLLKIAVVLVISGTTFFFYLWEIRWKEPVTE